VVRAANDELTEPEPLERKTVDEIKGKAVGNTHTEM